MRNPPSPRARLPRPRPAPRARLIAGLVMAAAVVAGVSTACSSSPSHASGQSSGQASSSDAGLAFSACMRSHGVPDFPDPTSNGGNSIQVQPGSVDPNTPAYQAALHSCQSLLPPGKTAGGSVSPSVRAQFLRYAACIRAHGEPNYPDPTFSGGAVNFGDLSGIDTNSPQYQAALHACASLNPENGHGGSR